VRARPFRNLGLQRRIMLYVTVGLSAMFGVLALLGLGAIDEATELVFSERLAAAHTTARILERDFEAIAIETREEAEELEQASAVEDGSTEGTAGLLLAHFSKRDVSPFFTVSGVWVLDPAGRLLDAAGNPPAGPPGQIGGEGAVLGVPSSDPAVLRSLGSVAGATPLAAIAVRAAGPAGSPGTILVVHTVGVNSTAAYVPAAHGRPPAQDQAGRCPQARRTVPPRGHRFGRHRRVGSR
jgi:hypothetical protein